MIVIHVKDQIFNLSFVEVIKKKQIACVYNNLRSQLKNVQLFRRKLKSF